jgi:hypothetical protein
MGGSDDPSDMINQIIESQPGASDMILQTALALLFPVAQAVRQPVPSIGPALERPPWDHRARRGNKWLRRPCFHRQLEFVNPSSLSDFSSQVGVTARLGSKASG